MLSSIKEFIKKHDKLYALALCIKNINRHEYIELLRGFYDVHNYDVASVLVHHYGENEPNKLIVSIDKDENNAGFCAMLFETLSCLDCADTADAIPVVKWSKHTIYYEPELDKKSTNVFEYYFNAVSDIKPDHIISYKNVINLSIASSFCRDKNYENIRWFYDKYILNRFAYLYGKYIHLNDDVNKYVSEQISELFGNAEKIIGVHVRGTDYNVGFKDHPIKIQPEEHIVKVKELMETGKYDKVFLATDDLKAIELFRQEFSNVLIYYIDTFRTENDIGPQLTPCVRYLHHYKLGIEVLRDVYTLARCDAMVCGVSNVSFAARYINLALHRKFDDVIILNNGINQTDSKVAKLMRKTSKMANECVE